MTVRAMPGAWASRGGALVYPGGGGSGGGTGTQRYPLCYGGGLSTSGAPGVGQRLRSGGISNSTTFTGADAGSEWTSPAAGTLNQVDMARTNVSGDSTISIDEAGVATGTTITIPTASARNSFRALGLAVADGARLSFRFDSGSNPDFCTIQAVLDIPVQA